MADYGTVGELSTKQQRAIAALLSSKSVAEAAAVAGIGDRTLFRWLTEDEFKASLSMAEGSLLDAATRRLLTLQEKAIETLETLLQGDATDSVKLRAAIAVLEVSLKLRELRDFEQRLATLESRGL